MSSWQPWVLIVLWTICLVAGLLLAFAAYQSGPLPGDLALGRALQQALPPRAQPGRCSACSAMPRGFFRSSPY